MLNMSNGNLTLQIHATIKTIRHCSTIVSILLAVPALYIVYQCVNRLSKRYSVLFAMIIILGLINDILLNMILDPIMLLPELCMLRESPLIPVPGTSTPELWVRFITMNTPIFGACFLERHQAVQKPKSRLRVSKRVRTFVTVLVAVISFSTASSMSIGKMNPDQEAIVLEALAIRWPTVAACRARCYERSAYINFAAAAIGGLLLCVAVTAAISLHTFASLRKTTILSEAFNQNNRAITKALLVQASSPFFLIVFPLIFSLVAVLLNAEGPLPFSICYMLNSLHSPIHSIILLTLIRMYRKNALEMFRKATVTMNLSDHTHSSTI